MCGQPHAYFAHIFSCIDLAAEDFLRFSINLLSKLSNLAELIAHTLYFNLNLLNIWPGANWSKDGITGQILSFYEDLGTMC
jgi:hypothetical protein